MIVNAAAGTGGPRSPALNGEEGLRDHSRHARRFLIAAGCVFAALVADILVAKIQVLMGASIPVHIGDTGQFLVLLLAVTLFVIGAILREKEAKRDPDE